MPMMDAAAARRFAASWIDAWNRHDLDAVLAHYAEDCEFSSPLIVDLAGEPTGVLRGKAALRAYWSLGLQRIPDLRFELVDVLAGIGQATVYYRGHRGMAAESCQFDANGLITRAAASYAAPAVPTPPPLTLPALDPASVPARTHSIYPTEALRQRVAGRAKRALGDALGLQNFGVNLVALEPGAVSALRHWHTRQDEFIYVLAGEVTLVTEQGEQSLRTGMCAGFPAGRADGHQLANRSGQIAMYLEVGDRLPGDQGHYPDEDLHASASRAAYRFSHRDGTPY
jgi:uncharacterized cupin superfamily protein